MTTLPLEPFTAAELARLESMEERASAAERVHELKTWPEFFRYVLDGSKTFEVRYDDRGFHVGDVLVLREWDPESREYTGRQCRRLITYVFGGALGPHVGAEVPLRSGYVALALSAVPPADETLRRVRELLEAWERQVAEPRELQDWQHFSKGQQKRMESVVRDLRDALDGVR